MLYQKIYQSPLGAMRLVASETDLLAIYFVGQRYEGLGFEGESIQEQSTPILETGVAWLTAYFVGENPSPADLSFAPRGTAFQHRVWQALQAIPYGQVVTYGDLAEQLECRSAQAIGTAVGKNPLSILIPCHRVLGVDGGLRGYAGGLDKKEWLLAHEQK